MNVHPIISLVIPTYNASRQALASVCALLDLVDEFEGQAEIIVVDDGSSEPDKAILCGFHDPSFRLLLNESNEGRGATRNAGAQAAKGQYLLFLDCDCRPKTPSFLDDHLAALHNGADVSLGPVTTLGSGFWGRYQREAATRRRRQFADGKVFAMTSANMMLTRRIFEQVGGFDTAYRGYGFEDRDLILRLAGAGARIAYTDAPVLHEADLSLAEVVRKMAEAGRATAPLFRQAHPGAYRKLGYAAIDADLKPWLAFAAHLSGKVVETTAPILERQIERLPFSIAAKIVKMCSAMAFMSGTAASS